MSDDKKDIVEKKRIKPVIEEIKPEEPIPVTPPVTAPAPVPEITKVEAPRETRSVPETNNIDTTQIDKENKGIFLKFFTITFLVVLFLLALGGGIYVYMNGIKNTGPAPSETPIESAAPSPEANGTPAASPSGSPKPLASYKVSILNGNGKIGAGSDAKAIVEKAGFKVSSLGNADNFNFDTTVIEAKDSVASSVIDTLKTALSSKYTVKIGDNLDGKDSFDIIITIGAK